jgi:hypothetical protein
MAPAKTRTYVETGTKRAFAGAIEWPGWCRAGRDPDSALGALFDYRTRYAKTLRGTRLGFEPPAGPAAFVVVERLKGDATTDFGAPSIAPTADERRITDAELARLCSILNACWRSFDLAVETARGKVLAKGPRGGGRDLRKIVDHVVDADGSYLRMLARKVEAGPKAERPPGTASPLPDLAGASAGCLGTSSVESRGTSSTTRGRSRTASPERRAGTVEA